MHFGLKTGRSDHKFDPFYGQPLRKLARRNPPDGDWLHFTKWTVVERRSPRPVDICNTSPRHQFSSRKIVEDLRMPLEHINYDALSQSAVSRGVSFPQSKRDCTSPIERELQHSGAGTTQHSIDGRRGSLLPLSGTSLSGDSRPVSGRSTATSGAETHRTIQTITGGTSTVAECITDQSEMPMTKTPGREGEIFYMRSSWTPSDKKIAQAMKEKAENPLPPLSSYLNRNYLLNMSTDGTKKKKMTFRESMEDAKFSRATRNCIPGPLVDGMTGRDTVMWYQPPNVDLPDQADRKLGEPEGINKGLDVTRGKRCAPRIAPIILKPSAMDTPEDTITHYMNERKEELEIEEEVEGVSSTLRGVDWRDDMRLDMTSLYEPNPKEYSGTCCSSLQSAVGLGIDLRDAHYVKSTEREKERKRVLKEERSKAKEVTRYIRAMMARKKKKPTADDRLAGSGFGSRGSLAGSKFGSYYSGVFNSNPGSPVQLSPRQ